MTLVTKFKSNTKNKKEEIRVSKRRKILSKKKERKKKKKFVASNILHVIGTHEQKKMNFG